MRYLPRIIAGVVGAFLVWLAVSLAINPSVIRPSATEPEAVAERVEFERTWYGEAARYGAAGLLGFFGLTIALAPWRGRR